MALGRSWDGGMNHITHYPWCEMLGALPWFNSTAWFINVPLVLQYAGKYLGGWCLDGLRVERELEYGTHRYVSASLSCSQTNKQTKEMLQKTEIPKWTQATSESGLPGYDLRLLYKSHQEGSIGQLNATANHKIQRISIMCSASDILKPLIFCFCRLLASSVHSAFGAKLGTHLGKNLTAQHSRFQGNWSQEPVLWIK